MGTKAKWLKGKLTFHNNAVVNEDVSSTSVVAGTTIKNWGMVVLSPAAAASYFIKGGPTIGQKLDIVVDTSEIASVFCSTTKNSVTIAGSSYNGLIFVPGAGKPQSAQLRGVTTTLWTVTSYSTMKGGFNLTTTTG